MTEPTQPKVHLHKGDLPKDVTFSGEIAVDCEMMGLRIAYDRLCLVQLKGRTGDVHLVQIAKGQASAPNLKKILEDENSLKIFHYARIDIAMLLEWLDIDCRPVFCTKIASKLVRTYGDRHGLKDVTREIVGIELNKQQTTTDWGADTLTKEQLEYAASDVLHLHAIKDRLVQMLEREHRLELAEACFEFLPVRAALDCLGWEEADIFAHS